MLRALILASTAAALLVATGVAGASNGKERVVVERFAGPYSLTVDCADFGPYAFSIVVAGTQKGSLTDVFASDGTLLQTVFHVVFTETDTNSVSGKTLRLHGAVTEVWDWASNTRTLTGTVFKGTGDKGHWVHDSGRITITLDTREALFVAGPHEAFFAGGIDPVACAAMAES